MVRRGAGPAEEKAVHSDSLTALHRHKDRGSHHPRPNGRGDPSGSVWGPTNDETPDPDGPPTIRTPIPPLAPTKDGRGGGGGDETTREGVEGDDLLFDACLDGRPRAHHRPAKGEGWTVGHWRQPLPDLAHTRILQGLPPVRPLRRRSAYG